MFIHRPIHELATAASYFIKTADVVIERIPGTNIARAVDRYGNTIAEGLDLSDTVNKVFAKYGSQRKKVVIIGDFIVSKRIDIPSNTVLEICGKLTLADNVNDSMFAIVGSNVEIYGGELDGNGVTQSASPSSGIRSASVYASGITNIVIHDIMIHDFRDQGIDITEGIGIKIYNVETYNNGRNGIYIGYNARKWFISGVVSHDNGWLAEGYGIMIGDGAEDGLVSNAELYGNALYGLGASTKNAQFVNIHAYNNGDNGIRLANCKNVKLKAIAHDNGGHGVAVLDSDGSTDSDNIELDVIVYNNTACGLNINWTGTTGYTYPRGIKARVIAFNNGQHGVLINALDVVVLGLAIRNGYHGFAVFSAAENVRLIGVIAKNNDQSQGGRNGIDIAGKNVIVIGCRCYDDQATKTQTYGIYVRSTAFNVKIIDCNAKDNETGALYIESGALNVLIKRVEGYRTENGGTATFTGDGSTTQFKIAHGLVSTPKIVIVTPKGSTPKPDSVDWDDTYIYINYSTAPAAGTTLVFSWFAEC